MSSFAEIGSLLKVNQGKFGSANRFIQGIMVLPGLPEREDLVVKGGYVVRLGPKFLAGQ